jgi:hypothetical protein
LVHTEEPICRAISGSSGAGPDQIVIDLLSEAYTGLTNRGDHETGTRARSDASLQAEVGSARAKASVKWGDFVFHGVSVMRR